ncbi:MAG TPA: hypothetical protein ENI16_00410 [Candidatus Portnoybacteria bacterium]|nr:hypothetical protein [Candidatus Portnoybacteria bacterium]
MEDQDQNKIDLIKQEITRLEKELEIAKKLLAEISGEEETEELKDKVNQGGKVIEGIFNGQSMVSNGKEYPVPANYASKSKLVEGDALKLTITDDGSFIFKQIKPVERKRVIGNLVQEENGDYSVLTEDNKSYRVLLASVTYFKAEPRDEVTLVIPKDKPGIWGAIENVIKKAEPETIKKPRPEEESEEQLEEETPEEKSLEDELIPNLEEIKKEAEDETDKGVN